MANSSSDDVDTDIWVGGIVGSYGKIANCYNTGKIYASASDTCYGGGIVGFGYNSKISCCYNLGEIEAYAKQAYIHGINGTNDNVTNCYYSSNVSGSGVSCTDLEMQQQSTFIGFDFSNIWCIDKLRDFPYPQLRANMQTPHVIDVQITSLPNEITVYPNKVIVVEGLTPELSGGEIMVTYSDGYSAKTTITGDMLGEINTDVVGLQESCIDYCGCFSKETILVEVITKDLTGISVTTAPNKLQYVKDQPFNPTGGKITLYYNNNSTEEIDLGQVELSYNKEETGTIVVTARYQGYSDTFEITVKPKVVKTISLLQKPTKIEYLEGMDLDLTGGILKVIYESDDNYFENINLTDSMVSGYDKNILGYQVVYIDYEGSQTNYRVLTTAKSLIGIEITSKPNKLSYLEGDSFDATGIVITAYYNNNTNENVTDQTVLTGYSSTPGTKTITAAFEGKTDSFTLIVEEKKLVSVEITTLPDKMKYFEDEPFDETGMVVTAHYNNGTAKTITDYAISSLNPVLGKKTIEISYAGKTDSLDIIILYTVVFKNWDNEVLSTKVYQYYDEIVVPDNPKKTSDKTYTYTFAGWDKKITTCEGNAIYIATYTSNFIDYKVVFKNWNGEVLSTKVYHYGDAVDIPKTPTKEGDNTYSYAFAGWDKDVVNCVGNATYTAIYAPVYVEYTVIFMNWNGEILSNKTYHYGDIVQTPEPPTRASTNTF
ncbi:MAG: bacterial Ig-like domain-containing protein, partial [Clostridia bacterium]|nr:bacterial Ig-like domain-containing protein [Clostridia bacterium]